LQDTADLIELYLRDLRAQGDSQLRRLRNAQRIFDTLSPPGDIHRAEQRLVIFSDLAEMLTTNERIRGVCEDAVTAAANIPD
jgi:hypothetical protein